MKKKTKILIMFLLCTLLFLLFLVSCGNNESGQGETKPTEAGSSDAEDSTESPADKLLRDNLPALDFEGYEYRVLVGEFPMFVNDLYYPESQVGEVLSDAFYARNTKIEERFNIKFKESTIDLFQLLATIRREVRAGVDAYDMYMQIDRDAYTASAEHLLYPISDLPRVDLTQPYWCVLPNRQLTVGGKQYVAFSDEMITFFEAAVLIYFNKRQVSDLGLVDLYGLVRAGSWTHDKFYEYAKAAVKDLNGDGNMTDADNWGIASDENLIFQCFWTSSGKYIVEKDKDDIPYFAIPGNQIFFDIASRVIDEFNSVTGIYMEGYKPNNLPNYGGYGTPARIAFFKDGHSLFNVGQIPEMIQLRDMEDDFGVLPFPKYKTDQPQYYTRVAGGFPFVIPTTNQRPEVAGAIMEAMACETRNTVIPAYYESALKAKYSRDADTAEMFDLIYDTRVYDLGDTIWCYPIREDYTKVFSSGNDTFASFTEKNTDRYNIEIQKAVEGILNKD